MSTERLMRSAARGDVQSLEELVRELAPEVYRYLAGMLGDPEEAEDAMEETFVRVARSAGRFNGGEDVRSWVFSLARRVAADVRPTPSASPQGVPEGAEDVSWARRALRSLPLEQRELVVARDVLGWDEDTTATVLGLEAGELSERLAVAREAMLGLSGRQASRVSAGEGEA